MGFDEFELRRLLTRLVIYYGVWQFIHMLSNLFGFLISMDSARSFLGGSMTDEMFKALLASGVIDLFVASPLGILFAIGYYRGSRWSVPIGIISLTISIYSAYLYLYLHITYGTLVFDLIDFILLWVLYLPCMLLFILLPWLTMRYGTNWFFEK